MIGQRLEKWCQSKYAHLGSAPIKSKDWHLKHHSELSFGEANLVGPLLGLVPKHHINIGSIWQEPGLSHCPVEEMAAEPTLHGAINEDEAKLYIQNMDDIFNNMGKNIKKGIENAMVVAITALKQTMEKVI